MHIDPITPSSQDSKLGELSQIRKDSPCLVLGLESSCDETAASVLRRHPNGTVDILSSIIASQNEQHAPFGGVVPEIAARAHIAKMDGIIKEAMAQSGIGFDDLDAIAATSGPGLIGGVISGLMTAKGLALSLGIPLIPVNHLEGHALSPKLEKPCDYPYLLLLVSGGHSQLLSVAGLGDYTLLGSTVDDAAGEAFDKTAKVMGLDFPGGPNLERLAQHGDANAIKLPRPFYGKPHANFSFAGLKTAAARAFDALDKTDPNAPANLAASFQKTCAEILKDRSQRAIDMFTARHKQAAPDTPRRFVIAGGVAANKTIRKALNELCAQNGFDLRVPPFKFCTDNAAMIALAGAEHFAAGNLQQADHYLAAPARPRWPLDSDAAKNNPRSGSGKKGPKS